MSKLEKILVISLTFVVAVFINFNFIKAVDLTLSENSTS